jgi:methylenetetrahydrofolate--tRNA-(uracil-5-)-methyltransferase
MAPVIGLLPPLDQKVKSKEEKKRLLAERAIRAMKSFKEEILKE